MRGPGAPFASSEDRRSVGSCTSRVARPGGAVGGVLGWCVERSGTPARPAAGALLERAWGGRARARGQDGGQRRSWGGRSPAGRAAQPQSGAARRARCPAVAEHRKGAARTGGGGPANSSEASAGEARSERSERAPTSAV